ncbi:uncharacterized protein LOC129217701 isoform X2 [Uloborus diversus]|uniref:uncharacterized protein LOC129217701 isoform X2 n=1 Tax=Uloborus diversus TaxID=327109 RepID=UPI002409FCAB|nr:uncharacterized protein LOC129217701 isoform X2 [Uloborus diversus]
MSSGDCYHPALLPLSWLFGKWESTEAEVSYPTMSAVKYKEVLEIQPSEKPIIQYQSNTWHLEKKHKMHSEMGFFRIRPGTKEVALIASHNFDCQGMVFEIRNFELCFADGDVQTPSTDPFGVQLLSDMKTKTCCILC